MRNIYILILSFLIIGMIGCSGEKKQQQEEKTSQAIDKQVEIDPAHNSYHVSMIGFDTVEFNKHYKNRIEPPFINLNQPLETKSISQLYLLGNSLLAMKGHLFKDEILLTHFNQFPWYQPPFWDEKFEVDLNNPEQLFMERVQNQMTILRDQNYLSGDDQLPNPVNILNAFQFENTSIPSSRPLASNGFVLESKSKHHQLFELYEQNKRENLPSFVTTDLILHQMHLFYGVLENEIEEQYLIGILKSMLEILNKELYSSYEKTINPKIEKSIEESLLFYSIPYAVITKKKNNLIGSYNELYYEELGKVLNGKGIGSKIMNNDQLNYGIFVPSGHYSKNEQTQNYFKALTWLQKVSLCLTNEEDFSNAVLAAYLISKSPEIQNQYRKYITLKTYFSSQKNQFTLWDLAEVIANIKNINSLDNLFQDTILNEIKDKLQLEKYSDCQLKVSLMPVEYQNLYTDLATIDAGEKSPSTVDLFAALQNPAALKLFEMNKEANSAEINQKHLKSITENLVNISTQEDAISMDWISTLLTSFNSPEMSLNYMKMDPWKRKELNAAMASWIQLNERVNLRAEGYNSKSTEQKLTSKSILKGYVEPNLDFWEAALTLLNNSKIFLTSKHMFSKKSARNMEALEDLITFLDKISKKEIDQIPLEDTEYTRIASIGSECHNLALSLINPNYSTKHQRISSDVAFATNVYRSNSTNLIAGIGQVNSIFVLVDIGGFIYLAKGAVFNYNELDNFAHKSPNQKQWIQILDNNSAPISWARSLFDDPGESNMELVSANKN